MKSVSNGIMNWSDQFISGISKPNTITQSYRQRINERRKMRRETVDFHMVEFNAWAYVGTDHLWAGLITHLYKEAEKYFGLELQSARLRQAFKKSLPKSLLIF